MNMPTIEPPVTLCRVCGAQIPRQSGRIGRPPVTCSPQCRQLHGASYALQAQIREQRLNDRIRQLELELSRLQGERSRCVCTPILLGIPPEVAANSEQETAQ